MTLSSPPINVQRSTFNAQRSTSELPNFRTSELPSSSLPTPPSALRRRSLRSGMTLLELVAALALFVIILGSLVMILNAATSLWGESRNQKKEQTVAQNVLDLMSDDLRHAVTDDGPDLNAAANPCFVMESPPSNPAPNEVTVLLGFARYAGSATPGAEMTGEPSLSVEAVFYTLYNRALYRHLVTLPCTYDGLPENKPTGIGEWLAACSNPLTGDLHDKIDRRAKVKANILEPVEPTQPARCHWACSLLAENASIELHAALPSKLALSESKAAEPAVVVDKLSDSREYRYLEARVLPDRIDIAVGIQTEESVKQPPKAAGGIEYQSCSQRITFPAQGGSRLP